MKIREDYIGNTYVHETIRGTIHGLKRSRDIRQEPHSLFCGCTHKWAEGFKPGPSESDRVEMAERINCKRCRSILELSHEASEKEKPDYYLIIDTSGDTKPVEVKLVDTIEEAEKFLERKLNEGVETPDSICKFRITGVKEVECYYHGILSQKYKVKLRKD